MTLVCVDTPELDYLLAHGSDVTRQLLAQTSPTANGIDVPFVVTSETKQAFRLWLTLDPSTWMNDVAVRVWPDVIQLLDYLGLTADVYTLLGQLHHRLADRAFRWNP